MNNKKQLGIYIHIPFCMHKCVYCDFLSAPADDNTKKMYVNALINEIKSVKEGKEDEVSSIFFGGGTPSVLASSLIDDIMAVIAGEYNISDDAEITIECNPGTLDYDKAAGYRKSGINRISFGLQSTDDDELKMLGRIHNLKQFEESFQAARRAGFNNINVDIMASLPGQSFKSFSQVLKKAVSYNPEHISVYSLILEEGTYLFEHIGEFPEVPDEDTDRKIYAFTGSLLKEAGYEQYEISNYALPGYECRHNLKYWERGNYLGFGIGAASLYDNTRFTNITHMGEYIKCLEMPLRGDAHIIADIRENVEMLTKNDTMSEFMFLGLRKTKGVSMDKFNTTFKRDIMDVFGDVIKENERNGLLEISDDRIFLTKRGMDISNRVMADFLLN
ncbi:MAG: radical SAM family heme chaperone HemW [Eubacteriales bacterium]|nr:radical SAM family heme chaperone HemW [Eubacteriales bacterium]